MKCTLKAIGLVSAFSLIVMAFGQEAAGAQGAQSEACRAYASTAGSAITGGMTGGEALGEQQISEASELENAAQATTLDESSEAMTGGAMTGGAMTGGAMSGGGGASVQANEVQNAVRGAVACLSELRADIEAGRNAEEAALAVFNIRGDLDRTLRAARLVEQSSETLVQLEALELQVGEQREEALTTLDQVTESLSTLFAGGGAAGGGQ